MRSQANSSRRGAVDAAPPAPAGRPLAVAPPLSQHLASASAIAPPVFGLSATSGPARSTAPVRRATATASMHVAPASMHVAPSFTSHHAASAAPASGRTRPAAAHASVSARGVPSSTAHSSAAHGHPTTALHTAPKRVAGSAAAASASAASSSAAASSVAASSSAASSAPSSARPPVSAALIASAIQAQWMSSKVKGLPGARRKPVKASALAQQLGLAPVPVPKLTSSQWTEVRLRAEARGDTSHTESCPICTEAFKDSSQVLLSCSHVFHKTCLRNFELFSGTKVCPICRSKEYEKRVIHEAASAYREACATKIQARFRGWRVRKQYLLMLSLIPPKDVGKRREFFMSKLGATSAALSDLMSVHQRALDAMFEEMDRSVHSVRQSLRAAEVQLKVFSADEWTSIRNRANLRGEEDCPICAETLAGGDQKKRAVLLSCSHVFHHGCLLSFERFTIASSALDGAEKSSWSTQQSMLDAACKEDGEMQLFQPPPACLCPLCRNNYQKAWL